MKKLIFIILIILTSLPVFSKYKPPSTTEPTKVFQINNTQKALMKKTFIWAATKNLSITSVNDELGLIIIQGDIGKFQKSEISTWSGKQKITNQVADCGECGGLVKYKVLATKVNMNLVFQETEDGGTSIFINCSFSDFIHNIDCLTIVCITLNVIETDLIKYLETNSNDK